MTGMKFNLFLTSIFLDILIEYANIWQFFYGNIAYCCKVTKPYRAISSLLLIFREDRRYKWK